MEGRGDEIGKLHLDDGAHAIDGSSNRHPDHGILADRRVEDTGFELLLQAFGRFKGASKITNILPVEKDALIFAELLELRGMDGIDVSDTHLFRTSLLLKWRSNLLDKDQGCFHAGQ